MIRPKLLTATGDPDIYIGEKEFTSGPGTFYFKVPLSVTRIHAVCVGAGAQGASDGQYGGNDIWGGGGGGGLGWRNNIEVTPGETLVVQVGAVVGANYASTEQGASWIKHMKEETAEFDVGSGEIITGEPEDGDPLVAGYSGGSNTYGNFYGGGSFLGDGGGDGGSGSSSSSYTGADGGTYVKSKGSGGGAGGYTGRGGRGCNLNGDPTQEGGGGSGGASTVANQAGTRSGYRGGGVGVYGKGASGATRRPEDIAWDSNASGGPGYPGSGGDKYTFGAGGAGAGSSDGEWNGLEDMQAGHGAVRIIWGNQFSYPDNADVEAE